MAKAQWFIFVLAALLLAVGAYLGLVWAPPERMMGEVQRIMYVHVPAVWMALVAYTIALCCGVMYLWKKDLRYDALNESAIEVGVFFNVLGLCLGAIWGRPTWGAYWTWDPRLTSTLLMCLIYIGALTLRRFIEDPDKRQVVSASFSIFGYASIILVWFSVRWFRSLHQTQSSPATVDSRMVLSLRVNAFAFLFLLIWFLWRRYLVAKRDMAALTAAPPPVVHG
jgi:heme exporter protein C